MPAKRLLPVKMMLNAPRVKPVLRVRVRRAAAVWRMGTVRRARPVLRVNVREGRVRPMKSAPTGLVVRPMAYVVLWLSAAETPIVQRVRYVPKDAVRVIPSASRTAIVGMAKCAVMANVLQPPNAKRMGTVHRA